MTTPHYRGYDLTNSPIKTAVLAAVHFWLIVRPLGMVKHNPISAIKTPATTALSDSATSFDGSNQPISVKCQFISQSTASHIMPTINFTAVTRRRTIAHQLSRLICVPIIFRCPYSSTPLLCLTSYLLCGLRYQFSPAHIDKPYSINENTCHQTRTGIFHRFLTCHRSMRLSLHFQ